MQNCGGNLYCTLRPRSRTGLLADSNHAARLRLTVRHGHHSLPPACIRNPTLFNTLDGLSKWSVLSVPFRPAFTEGASTHVCSLALPTEPVRGLGSITPLYDLPPTAALTCSCCPPYRTGTIWLPRFRDALPGPCGGIEPPSSGIAVMLTRNMEPGVGLEPTARCLQGNCSDH